MQRTEAKIDYAREAECARQVKQSYEQRMQFVLPRVEIPVEELMNRSKADLIKEFRGEALGYRGYISNASVPKAEMVADIKENLRRDYNYLMGVNW